MKYCLLYMQAWIIFLDFLLSLCMTPYVFFPACAGFTIGIFHNLNVPMDFQSFFAICCIAIMNLAVPIILENRHNILVRGRFRITRKFTRYVFYVSNVVVPILSHIPVALNLPDQTKAALTILETTVPCPTIEYFQYEIFALGLDNTISSIGIGTIVIFALSESLFFSIHSIHHLKKITNFTSKNTQKLQKSVFTAISLQLVTTTAVALIPASYFIVSIQSGYYNQAITNVCFILISIHGFLATISICTFYPDSTDITTCEDLPIIRSAIYIILDFLVMFSSIFYIFILVSVRNITRNASNFMKTRPEKVIIYQTLVLLFVKLLCFPLILFATGFLQDLNLNGILDVIYYPLFIIDFLTTPIVFQITYLFCNKTNLEILLKMNFRKLKTWKTICCGHNSSNYVQQYEISRFRVTTIT
ncbi:unnamed protein product [Caenorhabditis angaria]|uniref:Uncharacterized protein n=1 Tax=Caenorhabditis angaria TaxID=860376 RepID=A0A9P1N481_9PELO|nr:unnamed protein product [Caenorhabditis angaria]